MNGDRRAIGELVRRIGDDLKVIATGEVALARAELSKNLKLAVAEMAGLVLLGLVALIGFGLLCVSAVAALAAVIPPLWARLLLMAAVYIVVGGLGAYLIAKRLKRDVTPDLSRTKTEARRTAATIRQELSHA